MLQKKSYSDVVQFFSVCCMADKKKKVYTRRRCGAHNVLVPVINSRYSVIFRAII